MSNAPRDENNRTSIICASSVDGLTIVPIKVNPSNNALKVDDNTTGSDNGNNGGITMLDENGVSVWAAMSSDGSDTIIEVYGDSSTGKVLINSN